MDHRGRTEHHLNTVGGAYKHWFDVPGEALIELLQAHRERPDGLNSAADDK